MLFSKKRAARAPRTFLRSHDETDLDSFTQNIFKKCKKVEVERDGRATALNFNYQLAGLGEVINFGDS